MDTVYSIIFVDRWTHYFYKSTNYYVYYVLYLDINLNFFLHKYTILHVSIIMIVENCIKIIFVVPLLHLCSIFILKGVCHKIFSLFFHDLNSPGPRIKSEVVSNWVSILPRYYIIKLENSESTVCKTPRSPKILGLVSPHFVCFKSFHSWYKCSPMKEFYLSVPLGATRYRWLSEDGNFELWNWISSRNCLSLF